MKREKISEALGNISSRHIEEAIRFEAEAKRHYPKKSRTHWGALIAACFIFLACLIPMIDILEQSTPIVSSTTKNPSPTVRPEYNPPQDNNAPENVSPVSIEYSSIEAAHNALGFTTLYENIILDELNPSEISILYHFSDKEEDDSVDFERPRQLLVHTSYAVEGTIDSVDYYIIFNQDSIDDSYIGGYTEQGLTKVVNGITVHYSLTQSGDTLHGHAKFLHEGNLYVIDVQSWGQDTSTSAEDTPLFFYLDRILNKQENK